MADSVSSGNVVSLPRRTLFNEQAKVEMGLGLGYDRLELFDVPQLVIDSCATRSDLRIIEDNDDEVQQCIETRLAALLGQDWQLSGGSEEVRTWLSTQLERHYKTIVTNAFSAQLYGYSVQERIYAKEDGYYVVDRIGEKPFEWFTPKRDGTLWFRPKFSIVVPSSGRYDPMQGEQVDTKFKFLLTRFKPTWRNPRGRALLAYLFWPWFFRKTTWQFWMQFLERSGQPLLVGKGANPAQIAQQLASAVQDAVIGVPKDADVESISPSNKGEAFALAEDRLVRRIQKVLLGQTLTSDVATKGSGAKALGDVHNDVRKDKTIGDLHLVKEPLQNYLTALQLLNFPNSRPVVLEYDVERDINMARVSKDVQFLNTGQVAFTKEYYKRHHGYAEDEIEIIPGGTKNSQPGQDKQGKTGDKGNE